MSVQFQCIDAILTIKDDAFNIELNKLRKDLRKLINDHFKISISQRKSQALYLRVLRNMKQNY